MHLETLLVVLATVIVSDVTAPVLVCGPSEDVTTVTVDFEGSSVPEGWSVSNTAGDFDWTFGASGAINAGGTIPFASNAAIFDDDACWKWKCKQCITINPSMGYEWYIISNDVLRL